MSRNQISTIDTGNHGRNTRTTGFTSAAGGPVTIGFDASSFTQNLTNIHQTPGNDMMLNHPHSFDNHGSKSDIMFQSNMGKKDLSY
jgi:hypothetical protein